MPLLVILHSSLLALGMAASVLGLRFVLRSWGVPLDPPRYTEALLAGVVTAVTLLFFSQPTSPIWQNILLHSVGGGVACGFVFCGLLSQVKVRLTWHGALFALFFFVSAFGVANELAEYAIHATGIPMTGSLTDTWRDLTSNTVGAYIGYLLCSGAKRIL